MNSLARGLLCCIAFQISSCATESPLLTDSMDAKVHQLVSELGKPSLTPGKFEQFEGKQARIFKELEGLGEAAVPYIIKYMDDRRPLPYSYIALANKAKNSFESIRQYGPNQVVDGLAAVLNQITGENWGFIYNGSTVDARDQSVAQWRIWCAKRFVEQAGICLGKE